ncbi:Epimerase family protein [Bremerella volcania]|uniref:Epimerase family protein n=1 Tax=Bremerella volcania TaxID=2527984 RepID=A0A518C502_9BACT|nr:DUF1731 domain-containing protein [Bremerella volcania]QDU74286.1 Epimerase family protein [Bremerella volcania]
MTTTPNPRRVVIAGGSGFLGISLAHHLHENDYEVVLLSRSAPKCDGPWKHVAWDGRTLGNWKNCLGGALGMVNLAGRTVDCIKTPDHQDEILRSRVESTRVLGLAVRAIDQPPPVWVQMGTAHIYGDPPKAICTEGSSLGIGLAPLVGKAWEEEFHTAKLPAQRGVVLRTSFVVGRNRGAGGGALDRLSLLTRLGLGGRVGSGKQGFSWIHEHDLNRLFQQALTQDSMQGIYIASAPNPVSQVEFMQALRDALGVRFGLPAFAWMVRLGAPWLLKTDPNLALYGRYVRSERLPSEGFTFQFPEVGPALKNIVGRAI